MRREHRARMRVTHRPRSTANKQFYGASSTNLRIVPGPLAVDPATPGAIQCPTCKVYLPPSSRRPTEPRQHSRLGYSVQLREGRPMCGRELEVSERIPEFVAEEAGLVTVAQIARLVDEDPEVIRREFPIHGFASVGKLETSDVHGPGPSPALYEREAAIAVTRCLQVNAGRPAYCRRRHIGVTLD